MHMKFEGKKIQRQIWISSRAVLKRIVAVVA